MTYVCTKIALMNLLKLLPLLLCFSTFAQVNLYIQSETDHLFLIGINEFEQNPKAVKSLIIQKIDTFPFTLRVQLNEEIAFTKTMHFHQKGNYHYVITTNSQNKYQLRYRGEISSLPTEVQKMDLQSAINLKPLPMASATATKIPEAKPTKTDTIQTIAPHKVVVAAVPSAKPKAIVSPPPDTIKIKKPALSSFDQFMASYKTLEFEFEKQEEAKNYVLAHSVSLEDMQKIVAQMKYDNTKLELYRATKEKIKNLKNVESLSNTLEYEISKQQFKALFAL